MFAIDAAPTLDATTQSLFAIFLTLLTAVAAFFAQRAAKKGSTANRRIDVPVDGVGGHVKDPGPVLGEIQVSLQEAKESAKENSNKLDTLALAFAKHEGQHEGMVRDMERMMRRVFKNGEA